MPLSAYAQIEVSDTVIQKAANDLKPALCKNSVEQVIQIIEGCYATVDEDSENNNMNLCVVEDYFVMNIINAQKEVYLNNFKTDPYVNSDYAKNVNFIYRLSKHPNFTNSFTKKEDAQKVEKRVTTNIINILKEDRCYDPDILFSIR